MNYERMEKELKWALVNYPSCRLDGHPFKGHNFMTPDLIKITKVGDVWIEISMGAGFEHEPIIGVTFKRSGESYSMEESGMVRDVSAAIEAIESMKEKQGVKI